MGGRRLFASVAVACASLAACRLFVDLDGLGDGPAPRPDAPVGADVADVSVEAAADVAVDSAPVDAGTDVVLDAADAAVRFVRNGDFETAGAGCGPNWIQVGSVAARSATAHAGSASCQLCRNVSGNAQLDQVTVDHIPLGGASQCTVYAFFRSPDDAGVAQTIRLGIDWYDSTGTYMFDTGRNDAPVPSAWTQFSHSDTVPPGAVSGHPFAGGNGDQGQCILVDDVTLQCR